jgi:glutaredoxin
VSRTVTLFHAQGCHLCERAREQLVALGGELEFELVEIDIAGDADLEAGYREFLPVVELDGERLFTYYVFPDVLRRRLGGRSQSPA